MAFYESNYVAQSCDRIGYIKNEEGQIVINGLKENNRYKIIASNQPGTTEIVLSVEDLGHQDYNTARVYYYISNPNANNIIVQLTDNGQTSTNTYLGTDTSESYFPWCDRGEVRFTFQRTDIYPCLSCGGNCFVNDCPEGFQCTLQGGVYGCTPIPAGCTQCSGTCYVQNCTDGYTCQYIQGLGYSCQPEVLPCTSCSGTCDKPTCGEGYSCESTGDGQYACLEKFRIVGEWWFWFLIIVGAVIAFLILFFVIKAIKPKPSYSVSKKVDDELFI